jgi:hypothetical protein
MREHEVSHLGFPEVKTLKHLTLNTLYYFGISHVEISGLTSERELTLGYFGYRNTKMSNLYVLSHFGISQVEILGLASAGELALRCPRYRNAETPSSKRPTLSCARFPNLGLKVLHRVPGQIFTRFYDQTERSS